MQAFLPHRDETNETVGVKGKARTPARCAMDPGLEGVGAEHRVRTGDLRLGKATLYQLS